MKTKIDLFFDKLFLKA